MAALFKLLGRRWRQKVDVLTAPTANDILIAALLRAVGDHQRRKMNGHHPPQPPQIVVVSELED